MILVRQPIAPKGHKSMWYNYSFLSKPKAIEKSYFRWWRIFILLYNVFQREDRVYLVLS